MPEPTRRLAACVEEWPHCYEGGYNPSCCRFPKSCSCTVYDPQHVTEADLEPAPERLFQPPARPEIEPTLGEYMARIHADELAAMHAIRIDTGGIPHHVGPFPSSEAAFAWNDENRNGADCAVVTLHAPHRPHREPPHGED